MNEKQVRALLAIAVAYDNRRPSTANITAWLEASDRGRWTFDEAREAIHEHYATSSDFLMPAHITAFIKNKRTLPERFTALPAAQPAQDSRVRALVAEVANRLGWDRRQTQDDVALDVECPWCHAQPGKPCAQLRTRGPHRGEHVRRSMPHPTRTDLAKAALIAQSTTKDYS